MGNKALGWLKGHLRDTGYIFGSCENMFVRNFHIMIRILNIDFLYKQKVSSEPDTWMHESNINIYIYMYTYTHIHLKTNAIIKKLSFRLI